ncbi:MAG: tRNA (cytidine(34)-2'-O)-methyltransferase [Syntrophomonadaceae bacterium]|jgi:tRNA (cytidine/uridine-2'-O-)-methyltransferase
MHIVLVEPEIPQNTGNIARTCALTGTTLHLVKPLGFLLADRYLKRAGLDYWDKVTVKVWDGFEEVASAYPEAVFYFATTKASRCYTDVCYQSADFLVLGRETSGLPLALLQAYPDHTIRVPMLNLGRSLNIANTAAVLLYEALRQLGFPGLE